MKTVAIVSGGLDSTVMLYLMKSRGDEIKAISFDYGQRHSKELEFAKYHCDKLGITHDVVDLRAVGSLLSSSGSSLVSSNEVPEGHYEDESMKQTVVPNRNMIMLSIAAGIAIANKLDHVSYAAHFGDHAIYPDCRQVFASAMNTALMLADWSEVKLHRPFIQSTKAQIADIGFGLGVEFEKTWSCYKGQEFHCGKCGTCVERIEAFAIAGVNDSTRYQ